MVSCSQSSRRETVDDQEAKTRFQQSNNDCEDRISALGRLHIERHERTKSGCEFVLFLSLVVVLVRKSERGELTGILICLMPFTHFRTVIPVRFPGVEHLVSRFKEILGKRAKRRGDLTNALRLEQSPATE